MTRALWTEIALALAMARAAGHDIETVARAICRVLKAHSTRFDGRRFMQIVRSNMLR